VLFETKPAETSCKSGNACTNKNCKSRICKP
jgi:hypothetical protein